MIRSRWTHSAPLVAGLLLVAVPAFGDTDFLIGAGPDVGLWDVGDGHHKVGVHARAMVELGADNGRSSFRLDGSYSMFRALDIEGNEDLSGIQFLANWVLLLDPDAGVRPYWTLGIGFDRTLEPDPEDAAGDGLMAGTGVGLRFGWGNIEARFELWNLPYDQAGAHVPIFVAARF